MKVIYKYLLNFESKKQETVVRTPLVRAYRHFGFQHGEPMVWLEVEDDGHGPSYNVTFQIYATGEDIPLEATWVGTAQGPSFVWHCYVTKLEMSQSERE